MTVEEAKEFFEDFSAIINALRCLEDTGLGYLRLGQPATTLSGGEAQRLKLASFLAQRGCEDILFLFDEPTTGLHFDDVQKLLDVLNRLADRGNTILIIEHHPDVIKTADWIIDLGPEGGQSGGRLLAAAPPEQVAKVKGSHTGKLLAKILRNHHAR